jgi:hypothetical protein
MVDVDGNAVVNSGFCTDTGSRRMALSFVAYNSLAEGGGAERVISAACFGTAGEAGQAAS